MNKINKGDEMDDFKYVTECYNICKKCDFDREEIGSYVYGSSVYVDKIIENGRKYLKLTNGNQSIDFNNPLSSHEQVVSWLSKSNKRAQYYVDFGKSNDKLFREYLMMDCYFTFIANDKQKTKELIDRIGINERTIKKYARIYYKEYMGLSDNCFKRLEARMELSNGFIEKLYEMFFDKANSIETFKVDFPRILYDYFKEYNFSIKIIKDTARKAEISYKRIIRYVMMYARDELKIDNFIITDEKDEDKIMSQSGINAWIGKSEIRRQFYENYKGEPAEFMNYILKYCYEYAESVQYNIAKMTELGNKFELNYGTIFNYVKIYCINTLGLNWNEKSKEITLIRTNIKNRGKLEKWLNNVEFKKIYDKLGGGDYDRFMRGFVKYCFEYCNLVNFNAYRLEVFLKPFDFTIDDMFRFFKNYRDVLGVTTSQLNEIYKQIKLEKKNGNFSIRSKQMSLICNKLESVSTVSEIDEIIKSYKKVDLKLLSNYTFDYVTGFYYDMSVVEQDELIMSLRNKINKYQVYLEEKANIANGEKIANSKILQNKLKKARRTISDYINSKAEFIEEYCRIKSLSEDDFRKHLEMIKVYDQELYSEYQEKNNSINIDSDYEENVKTVKKIVKLIRKGLVIDGDEVRERTDVNESYRPMDLFDYYQITNLSFDKIYRIGMKCLDRIELKSLGSFISKNIYVGSIDREEILTKDYILLGIQVKNEEKKAVVRYLEENNIPVNEEIVKIVLRRYLNGKYKLDGKKLVKKVEE